MDISKITETELKALWYDELTKKEQAEANMRAINDQIIKVRQEPSEPQVAFDDVEVLENSDAEEEKV